MRALDRKLFRDLGRIRTQAFAIAAVVASGIAVSVLGLCNLETLARSRADFYEQARFADVFISLKRAPLTAAARLSDIPGILTVEPRVVGEVLLDMPDLPEPVAARIIGLPKGRRPRLNDVVIRRGQEIDPDSPDEVLVSESFAGAHRLLPGRTITCILNGRRRTLRVAGIALSPEFVYAIRPGTLFPDDRRFGVLWMAEAPLAAALDMTGAFNDALLRLDPGTSPDVVRADVDRVVQRFGGIGAVDRMDQTSHWFLEGELSELRTTSRILPLVFAAVAAFVLNIVMSRLIATQREQIGLLKAFGYGAGAIAAHYLRLALAIALGGVVLGVPLGVWLGWSLSNLYGRFFHFPSLTFTLPFLALGVVSAIAVLVTLGGAALAIRGAVRLPAAEAMRPAAPARFRTSLVERIRLGRRISPMTRVVLRNLERRPVRAGLSIAAIALAASIMLLGRFSDALEYIVQTELEVAQRQTATVTFTDPRPLRVVHELMHYPGVIGVEPFRVVPVILRHGARTHRGSITATATPAVLSRVLNRKRRPVTVPDRGLVLSDKLARMLGVVPGDTLSVEVREGTRPVREIVVAATVEDYLGTPAYASLGAVDNLVYERRTASGAHVVIDPVHEAAFLDRLKATPRLAGYSATSAVRRSIRATLSESMAISLSFLIVLAGVIAFGVVYNTARIALSERAWELATLRVIGFTRREVTRILLAESAIVVALAIPAGLLLGRAEAAVVSAAYDSAQFRIPVVLTRFSHGFAAFVVIAAAIFSSAVVAGLIRRLDLIAVLKTRE
jgi:putative ABC transport system permease protein